MVVDLHFLFDLVEY